MAYASSEIAVYRFASRGEWYASQNTCPHRGEAVLSRGILGDLKGEPKVACPLHKKTFSLASGAGLNDEAYRIATYPVRIEDGSVFVELPRPAELDRRPRAAHACAGACS